MPRASATPVLDPQLVHWVHDRWRAVVRYRGRVVLGFLAVMVLVTVGLLVCPRTYESQAKLFVRVGRESVTLDPTATTGATIAVSETREGEITSVIEMLGSRALREDVVLVLGPGVILGTTPLPAAAEIDKRLDLLSRRAAGSSWTAAPTSADVEKAVETLEKTISWHHARKSSVITLSAEADSPAAAQQILRVFLIAFQAQHVRVHQHAEAQPFFTEQATVLKGELDSATAALRDAKNAAGVVALEQRREALEQELGEIRRKRLDNDAQLASTEATIRELERQQGTLPQRQVAQEVIAQPDDPLSMTRRSLTDLRIRERDLLARYTPYHPLVSALRQQIRQAELVLKEAAQSPQPETTTSLSPAWQQASLQLVTEQSNVAALRSRQAALTGQLTELEATLRQLNSDEGRIRRLQQEADILQGSYGEYLHKREQARVDQALGTERISNVSLVQPASYVSKPVSPKRVLIFILALFVAGCFGVGLAFLGEVAETWQAPAPVVVHVVAPLARPVPSSAASESPDHGVEHVSELVAAARD